MVILTHCDNTTGTEGGPHPSWGWAWAERIPQRRPQCSLKDMKLSS